jgi:hypothetical protein
VVRWGILPGFWADGIIRSGEVHDRCGSAAASRRAWGHVFSLWGDLQDGLRWLMIMEC